MDNSKSFSVIDNHDIEGKIHLIGVGATGSMVADNLIRLNLGSKLVVYDYDKVEAKNLNNQVYLSKHIGVPKVEALKDYASMIDPDLNLKGRNKKVEYLRTTSKDVVIITTDNFPSRASILRNLDGNPLVITGGISSTGGNTEVIRGRANYDKLAEEYENTVVGELPPEELSPCGSPISIYHRIRTEASLMAEALVKYHDDTEDMYEVTHYDLPNNLILCTTGKRN